MKTILISFLLLLSFCTLAESDDVCIFMNGNCGTKINCTDKDDYKELKLMISKLKMPSKEIIQHLFVKKYNLEGSNLNNLIFRRKNY